MTSNIVPQTPECNRGVWKYFEEYCRQIIEDDKNVELYVYAGIYGQSCTISKKNICVPAYCWKVVIILPVGDNDLSRISTDTKTIAMWMPNTIDCNNVPFRSYVTTIRYIEKKTGYNFLENVNVEIQDIIENTTYSFDE